MPSPLLLLLLLSLSFHACNTRHLGAIRGDHGKDVEKVKYEMTSTHPKPMQSIFVELLSQQHEPMNEADRVDERVSSATTKDSSDMKGTRGEISGLKNLMYSLDVGLRQTTKLEEIERRARSVLGSGSEVGHVATISEERKEFNEADVDEDGDDSMDYAQPHRKPPIHNESP